VSASGLRDSLRRSTMHPPEHPPRPDAGPTNPIGAVPDAALLTGIAAGDREALAELYRRHAGWLTLRLQRRCADPEQVDVALQDTFLAVWRAPQSYRGDGAVGAWLWGIAVRRLVDQLRRRRPVPVDPSILATPGAVGTGPAASVPSAENGALDGTLAGGDLGDAFAYLAPELRAVLVATAIDGLSTKEAAVLLGIPHGTVKTRLSRARAQLRGHLGNVQGGLA